jgi:hypothetical protein
MEEETSQGCPLSPLFASLLLHDYLNPSRTPPLVEPGRYEFTVSIVSQEFLGVGEEFSQFVDVAKGTEKKRRRRRRRKIRRVRRTNKLSVSQGGSKDRRWHCFVHRSLLSVGASLFR